MRYFGVLALFILTQFSFAQSSYASEAIPSTTVRVLKFNGVINPVSAEYLGGSINRINADRSASLIVIMLDTPGGLDTSMRVIIKEIMASRIPIAVYVAPSGSRAASAGTFITMAAHISAMSPGTSMGSAHPVNMGGEKMDETMLKKAENDAAAYIKSIATERGRNGEWAENAVRNSVSLGEQDALKNKVIDIVAKDLNDLLKQVNGRKVKIAGMEIILNTESCAIVYQEMSQRQNALNAISDPTIAYMLLMLGFYGLFFELSNPGVILPGVIGGICLVVGFYCLQSLPVNYAAVLLLILGVVLFLSELYVTSHGALTIGGIISITLGAVLLMDTSAPYMKVRLGVIVPIAIAMGGVFVGFLWYGLFFTSKKVPTGADGLLGLEGKTLTAVGASGKVEVDGEIWEGRSSDGEIEMGTHITVVKKDGPVLLVKRS
jgi:membrane-bound serine protease (ClpP class)